MTLSIDEGKAIVALARETLDAHLRGANRRSAIPSSGPLSEKRGVFVTLNVYASEGERLRGCIGFPYPTTILSEGVREAAIAAATEDPRFPPVTARELDRIVIEVSVLTPPQPLVAERRQDVQDKVRIGVDGLIASTSYTSGLLLPQVATEFKLGPAEFLSQVCLKAGLPPDAWLDAGTKLQVFQAEIFGEESPRGDVKRF